MKRAIIFLIFMLISGCAGVSVKKYKDTVYPATSQADIVVYPKKPVERKFIELGEVTVTGADNWGEVEKVFKKKSAQMGADAIYVLKQEKETKEYAARDNCYAYEEYYYPYQHFGWRSRDPGRFYPRGSYYCYGYSPGKKSIVFISAVGIAIKFIQQDSTRQKQL